MTSTSQDYHMSKNNSPTPEELKKAEDKVRLFDELVQQGLTFNSPLTRGEKALLTTFYVWLMKSKGSEPLQ